MKTVLFFSMLVLIYIYAGYPLIVSLLAQVRKKDVRGGAFEPSVTVLISAYNEEDHIEDTILNKLQLSYPDGKLEILVVSDGSTDRTDDIVKAMSQRSVRFVRQERAGKTSALNLAVTKATGEILVFSDANSIYEPEALKHLVANFLDPDVGYVTGKMVYVDDTGTLVGDGCSAYMKYENYLRSCETRIGSIVGVDGGIDAMRKSLYRPMRAEQLPDFILPLTVIEMGFRVVYEPQAVLRENSLENAADEYRMRVRVSLRALRALMDKKSLLNPVKHPLFSWELFSHKVMRYLAFLPLAAAFVANALLLEAGFLYLLFFVLQCLCYGAALLSLYLERKGVTVRLFTVPYYFSLINLAAAHAFLKFLSGHRQVTWQPRKGS